MDETLHLRAHEDFPLDLEDDLGEVVAWQEECPGVYYVAFDKHDIHEENEFYIIQRNIPHISEAAKRYG